LHAWSLGACVIAFRDCREAMPEIQHGYNALLGDTAEDIAELIFKALNDQILRRRIGLGGIETLKNSFSPVYVSQRLVENMKYFGM
jgi:hypothetical protein